MLLLMLLLLLMLELELELELENVAKAHFFEIVSMLSKMCR